MRRVSANGFHPFTVALISGRQFKEVGKPGKSYGIGLGGDCGLTVGQIDFIRGSPIFNIRVIMESLFPA